jgi:hypothetical protein
MVPNNGQLAQRFEETTRNFTGSKTRSTFQSLPTTTRARKQGMQEIYAISKQQGVPLDQVITQILKNSSDEVRAYIMSKGETPVPDPTAQGLQAILLRAGDVGMTANILDVPDEDALESIEQAESESIRLNSPEQEQVPTIPVQAAMACGMQYLSENAPAGSNTMFAILKSIHKLGKKLSSQKAYNNDIGDIGDPSDADTDWGDWDSDDSTDTTDPDTLAASSSGGDLSSVSVSSSLAAIPGGTVTGATGAPSVAANFPSISTSASSLPVASGGSGLSLGGVLNAAQSMFNVLGQYVSINPVSANNANATAVRRSVNTSGTSASSILSNPLFILVIIVIIILLVTHH